jgi:hypothetical protein
MTKVRIIQNVVRDGRHTNFVVVIDKGTEQHHYDCDQVDLMTGKFGAQRVPLQDLIDLAKGDL